MTRAPRNQARPDAERAAGASPDRYEVVVVGSGAGGGVVAGELADHGHRVLLLEAGAHRTAADYMRWEAWANHELWWPPAFAEPPAENEPPLIIFRGRSVGGTTAINTKVALRPDGEDYAKWYEASGLLGGDGEPFSEAEMAPYFERVEQRLGVRERSDWQQCIRTVVPGFEALGAELEPVMSYTDENCMRCGSCLQGCPTNAGKSTLNTYIHPPWARGRLELRPDCTVRRVLIEDRGDGLHATGVEYVGPDGQIETVAADVVVVAAGALGSPWTAAPIGRPRGGGRLSEQRADRPASRLSSRAPGRGVLRRDPGRAHGVSDQRSLHEVPPRFRRRLRRRGVDRPGPDRVRDSAVRRGRDAFVGRGAGAGAARLPLLHRPVDDGQRREPRDRLGR